MIYYPGLSDSRACLCLSEHPLNREADSVRSTELGVDHPLRLGGGHRVTTAMCSEEEDFARQLAPRNTHLKQSVVSYSWVISWEQGTLKLILETQVGN